MSKIPLFIVILSASLMFSACSVPFLSNKAPTPTSISLNQNDPTLPTTTNSKLTPTSSKNNSSNFVALDTKYGQVVIKLYQSEAPKSVANFVSKAKSGFYKNLTFHRVEPGFVVQGGDPLGNGTGGGQINSEINSIPFKRGTVGLARGMDIKVSNDSQFFICLSDLQCKHLTNNYVNIGEVVSGMEYIDQIKVGDKIINVSTTTK